MMSTTAPSVEGCRIDRDRGGIAAGGIALDCEFINNMLTVSASGTAVTIIRE